MCLWYMCVVYVHTCVQALIQACLYEARQRRVSGVLLHHTLHISSSLLLNLKLGYRFWFPPLLHITGVMSMGMRMTDSDPLSQLPRSMCQNWCLGKTSLHEWTSFCLYIYLSVDTWLACTFCLSWLMPLWKWCLLGFCFLLFQTYTWRWDFTFSFSSSFSFCAGD